MDDGKDQNAGGKRQKCRMEHEIVREEKTRKNPDQMETNPMEKKVESKPSLQVVEVVLCRKRVNCRGTALKSSDHKRAC
ncbi:hypothetical protein BOTNAR_0361g00050 [Botryotinia narcissicola]|uniref:Uncharacterized protein n=1 Tax=Botryotinia narcissicola TaxID=278944 RepID=A0A4Z1HR57_9HELO|nr:hypothetical protein BOTNAR_0361g00050 [Botryotinia narcissicola]